jgi:ribosome-binding factor A
MDERRAKRISEAMREELAEIVGYEMADPRVASADIIDVHVSPDLRHAQVMLAAEPGAGQDALLALEGARGFLRRQLAARLELHRMPDLHFALEALESGARLGHLMKRVRRGRPRDSDSGQDEKKPVE